MNPIRHLDHSIGVNVIRFTSDGRYCLTGCDDRSIRLWNPHKSSEDSVNNAEALPSALCIKTYKDNFSKSIYDCIASHDNQYYAACGGDSYIGVIDVPSGSVIRKLTRTNNNSKQSQVHPSLQKLNTICRNQDSNLLFAGGYDCHAYIWDLRMNARNDMVMKLEGAKDSVTSIQYLHPDQILPSGPSQPLQQQRKRHKGNNNNNNNNNDNDNTALYSDLMAQASAPGNEYTIITGSADNHLRCYDVRKGLLKEYDYKSSISSTCLSKDKSLLYVYCLGQNKVKSKRSSVGHTRGSNTTTSSSNPLKSAVYHSEGGGYSTEDIDDSTSDKHYSNKLQYQGSVLLHSLESGEILQSFHDTHTSSIKTECCVVRTQIDTPTTTASNNKKREKDNDESENTLVTGSEDGYLDFWHVATGHRVGRQRASQGSGSGSSVSSVSSCMSSGDHLLLSACYNGKCRLWGGSRS